MSRPLLHDADSEYTESSENVVYTSDDEPHDDEHCHNHPLRCHTNCCEEKLDCADPCGVTKDVFSASDNAKAIRTLWIASALCAIFMLAEFAGGFYAGSLALMTDAAHLLSDLAGFMISIFALWIGSKEPTSRLSFGWHRAEILGALMSVLLIWMITGILIYEAILRTIKPTDVDGKLMFFIATGGLVVNIVMGIILHKGGHVHSHGLGGGHGHSHGGDSHGHAHGGGHAHTEHDALTNHRDHVHVSVNGELQSPVSEATRQRNGYSTLQENNAHTHTEHENINVRAAMIHAIGDGVQSVGVMIAAGLIWYNPDWKLADPICTFSFSIIVIFTTVRLVKQSLSVLMEGVPEGIEPADVLKDLCSIKGVKHVHDLHIWSLSVGKPALSCHLTAKRSATDVLKEAARICETKYNILHSTIQVERRSDGLKCKVHHD